jgi:DNA polymerase III alpha subunit
MNYNAYGQCWTTTEELFDLLYQNPTVDLAAIQVKDPELYNSSIRHFYADMPKLQKFEAIDWGGVEGFDRHCQSKWYMPKEYQDLDIAEHILSLCKTQEELQRVGQELLLYADRELLDLLRYLKYFVDTMRSNKVVWGLGRGSSVASYVLYLLGVHKINSMYYDLDIHEFLK